MKNYKFNYALTIAIYALLILTLIDRLDEKERVYRIIELKEAVENMDTIHVFHMLETGEGIMVDTVYLKSPKTDTTIWIDPPEYEIDESINEGTYEVLTSD